MDLEEDKDKITNYCDANAFFQVLTKFENGTERYFSGRPQRPSYRCIVDKLFQNVLFN